MSRPIRGADIVARSLSRLGGRQVFTLSGNHIMSIFDAALEAKLDLVHVRHEAAAVHMADAWGRLTGDAGIALVTGGPGHANAVGALFTALASQASAISSSIRLRGLIFLRSAYEAGVVVSSSTANLPAANGTRSPRARRARSQEREDGSSRRASCRPRRGRGKPCAS